MYACIDKCTTVCVPMYADTYVLMYEYACMYIHMYEYICTAMLDAAPPNPISSGAGGPS